MSKRRGEDNPNQPNITEPMEDKDYSFEGIVMRTRMEERGLDLRERCHCSKRARPRRSNLYLALADCEGVFSIHKIDTYSFKSDKDLGFTHLPEPALRVDKSANLAVFAAMGHRIFIARNASPELPSSSEQATTCPELTTNSEQATTFVYDTKMSALCFDGPPLPDSLLGGCHTTVAVGKMLYVLSTHCGRSGEQQQQHHHFGVMSEATKEGWSWKSLSSPPFGPEEIVASYALHPDERTIFMSTRDVTCGHGKCTYSFDTYRCNWSCLGQWVLPFIGRGYFDSELDAWVGLHKDGHVCSCEVASSRATSTKLPQPNWVMGKEKLFGKDTAHLTASLICMGENKYCLLESMTCEGVEVEKAPAEPDCYVLHLTMFYPRYNKKGELKTTMHHPTRSYLVPQYRDAFSLGAFWI